MDKLKKLLRLHEDLRLRAYRCPAGKWTIGVGKNLEDNPLTPEEKAMLSDQSWTDWPDLQITEAEAWMLLEHDLARVRWELSRLPWFAGLDEVRQAVLLDMCLNLGWSRFRKFRHMLAALRLGDHNEAAAEMMDSKWAGQVKTRAARLERMMLTGQWPPEIA